MRQLTIESLERRCPMDAAGIISEFEQISIIRSQPMVDTASLPAITCYPEEMLRLPPLADQHGDPEAISDRQQLGPSEGRDVLLGPQDDLIIPSDSPIEPDFRENGESTAGEGGKPPSAAQDPLATPSDSGPSDFDFADLRPEPIGFVPPRGPAGSISLAPQGHVRRIDLTANELRSQGMRTAAFAADTNVAAVANEGADSGRGYRRSEVSLSRTRYYEPSEEPVGDVAGMLHGDTMSLRVFAGQTMPHDAGIAIGGSDHKDAGQATFTHWYPATGATAQAATPDQLEAALDEAQIDIVFADGVWDLPNTVPVASNEVRDRLVLTAGPSEHGLDDAIQGREQTAGKDAAIDPGEPVQNFIASLSRLAALGLLLSPHRRRPPNRRRTV